MQFSILQLQSMPTLESAHTSDLKVDDGQKRVWLSRLSIEDGEPYNHTVYVEQYIDGKWSLVEYYDASAV